MIGLSVVMLGQAPGTDLLNHWVEDVNDGMSLEDIANHIAESDAFTTTYPTFLTNAEFAASFLENLMGSEEVPAALVTAAEGIVTGLLNDGMTRGALALAVFTAMYEIHDQGEAHSAYADLGMVANGLFNKIAVAEYYTVDLRQANPNSRVLSDVNSEMGLDEVRDSISDHLDPPDPILLTNQRDNVVGTAANDLIVAEPDSNGNDTLDPFDVIDGGGGNDSLEVYASGTEDIEIDANGADVTNVERVYLSTRGAIDVDLSGWEGLETVELGRFGNDAAVSVKVDGASVSTTRTYGGDVTIVGAMGEVSVMAGSSSAIRVGSGAHTTSVMTKGGASVDVNLNGAGGQSMTVTSVMLDGVKGEDLGGDGKRGNPMEEVGVTIAAGNDGLTPSATVTQYVTWDGSAATPVSDADAAANMYYIAAAQPSVADTALVEGQVVVTTTKDDAQMREQVFVDGKRVDPGTADAVSGVDSGGVPIHVNSDSIETVSLSNTYATIAVINKSDDAEDLMITVDKYGSSNDVRGKFCITGDGAAENVSITVAGDSYFYLANNATKTVSISGDADLTLEVTDFVGPPTNVDAGGANMPKASTTLESITLSGSGNVNMKYDMSAHEKLATVDASAASGDIVMTMLGDSLTSYEGGSAFDCIGLAAYAADGVTVNLGAGNDVFKSGAGNSKSRVDGGAGMDTLQLKAGGDVTYKGADDKQHSIYSNFEVLDVGGGSGAYDIGLLGVDSVIVSENTGEGGVMLNNMGDGMGLTVNGKAGMGTMATVVHNMKDRSAGDARYSGVLDVTLTANGSKTDTAMSGTGAASLTLTADEEIETLNIASNANPSGKAGMATYQNSLTVMGAHAGEAGSETAVESSVEAIVVTGSARAMISLANSTVGTPGDATQFAELELIDAENNTGGVTFTADISAAQDGSVVLAQALELAGGGGKDMFTGGAGADKLMGNGGVDTLNGGAGTDTITGGAGGDTLTGGADNDTFKYGSASESQVVFGEKGMSGFDTITDFGTGTNTISLGKSLYGSLQGTIRVYENDAAINSTDTADPDTTVNSLKAFLDGFKGDGVFESRGTVDAGTLGQGELIKHSIATVTETYWATAPVADDPDTAEDETVAGVSASRKWILIDVDGDGDFDAGTDMAIALTDATTTVGVGNFGE